MIPSRRPAHSRAIGVNGARWTELWLLRGGCKGGRILEHRVVQKHPDTLDTLVELGRDVAWSARKEGHLPFLHTGGLSESERCSMYCCGVPGDGPGPYVSRETISNEVYIYIEFWRSRLFTSRPLCPHGTPQVSLDKSCA